MEEDWAGTGGVEWRTGGLEDWRTGGLEEDRRSIGGALEEDGPPKYGLGTPQYGDYVATSWKNAIFFCQNDVFWATFSFRALKLLANHEKQLFTFVCFLPSYFGVSRSLA